MTESDERVQKLEAEVTNLRISNATLSVAVEHLATAVKGLTETVQVLRDTLNQGRCGLLSWRAVASARSSALFSANCSRRSQHELWHR